MTRNIHASCSPEDVMADLQNKNFAIMEVSQIWSRKDKTPLPLYMLTFEKKEDIKRIFEIKEILSMKVMIEAL
jgi:predicted solute-binding protein